MLNEIFKHQYFINLHHRTDRLAQARNEFARIGIDPQRVEGVSPREGLPIISGQAGCLFSHYGIIERAYRRSLERILIFEDDVVFDPEFNQKFDDWYDEVPSNWQLLYLGGNVNIGTQLEQLTEHVFKAHWIYSTHAYCIHGSIFRDLLREMGQMNRNVDVVLSDYQEYCNAFIFRPRLAWQAAGYSDIDHKNSDYAFLRDQ